MQRPDGSILKFDDNACVLVNKTGDPIGTRMNGRLPPAIRLSNRLSDTVMLILLQELLLRSYEESNGRRFCLWRLYMCKIYLWKAIRICSISTCVPIGKKKKNH